MCCCRASVSVYSHLRSRSQSREGDEHLVEVLEEEETGKRGEGTRVNKERIVQGERKGSRDKVDKDKQHHEEMLMKEDDLHQRSISETDLR